jgi:DNA-binding IclR family transcriptional regulator
MNTVAEHPEGLSAKQIYLRLNIPPATCYRILRTLVLHLWLEEGPGGLYRPGLGMGRLAQPLRAFEERLELLKPPIEQLAKQTGLSAKISVIEGNSALVVARFESDRPNNITTPIGTRLALAGAGSAGVILLALMSSEGAAHALKELEPERRQALLREAKNARQAGLACSYGTHDSTIYALSVPLEMDRPAALSLVGWPEDFSTNEKRKRQENAITRFRDSLTGESTSSSA